jgi:ATP-dependent DNA helicase RecQ
MLHRSITQKKREDWREGLLDQQELMNKMANAYELQEILKKERLEVRSHEEEYQKLIKEIISAKVQKLGEYEVSEKEVQKKRYIVSDKFRERWPDLFNKLAKVTVKAAKEVIDEKDLEDVSETRIIKKPVIIFNG